MNFSVCVSLNFGQSQAVSPLNLTKTFMMSSDDAMVSSDWAWSCGSQVHYSKCRIPLKGILIQHKAVSCDTVSLSAAPPTGNCLSSQLISWWSHFTLKRSFKLFLLNKGLVCWMWMLDTHIFFCVFLEQKHSFSLSAAWFRDQDYSQDFRLVRSWPQISLSPTTVCLVIYGYFAYSLLIYKPY